MLAELLPWIGFVAGVAVMLALDLGVFHRGEHKMGVKEALTWSAVWIALAMAFAGGVWMWKGAQAGQEFLAGYFIEKSLSIDNLFVFVLVFGALAIKPIHQHKVLFWGIFGAIAMRIVFIIGGLKLLESFHWIIYVFGAFLIYTAVKMWKGDDEDVDPEKNPIVKFVKRFMPVDCRHEGHSFTVVKDGVRYLTPLALALVAIESADLVFAVDSVPAVLAVSKDPFIVFTSNVFAILGLRSLYFALAHCVERFEYLHYGLAMVLGFVGTKMLASDIVHLPTWAAIGVIVALVGGSIAYSMHRTRTCTAVFPDREPEPEPADVAA